MTTYQESTYFCLRNSKFKRSMDEGPCYKKFKY